MFRLAATAVKECYAELMFPQLLTWAVYSFIIRQTVSSPIAVLCDIRHISGYAIRGASIGLIILILSDAVRKLD